MMGGARPTLSRPVRQGRRKPPGRRSLCRKTSNSRLTFA